MKKYLIKNTHYILLFQKNVLNLHSEKENGTLTEWLGSGLQNRVQQFESAGYLKGG